MFDPSGPPPVQNESASHARSSSSPALEPLLTTLLVPLLAERFYGTFTYAAPEVFSNAPYEMLPAEVWSLGVLLHVLLTGENPHRTPEDAVAGRRIATRTVMSPLAADLLNRCLTVDVESRIKLDEIRQHPWLVGQWAI